MRDAGRWGAVVVTLLLWAVTAEGYTGDYAIWASKGTPQGDFLSQNFAGTQVGYDAAITYVGNNGTIHLGPNSDGLNLGTIPNGVLVIQKTVNGYVVHGTPFKWKTRAGTETARMDSSGVTVDGRVSADSLRGDAGLFVGGARMSKILVGTFTHDFANVSAGTTLDETQTVTGLDVAGTWTVTVAPTGADMSSGLGIAWARVSADNTLKIRVISTCSAAVDNPSQSFSYVAIRQ